MAVTTSIDISLNQSLKRLADGAFKGSSTKIMISNAVYKWH